MAYRRDNNELLLFVLKQLAKEQVTFSRSRYRSEPAVIEIQEDEFTDRVSLCACFKTFEDLNGLYQEGHFYRNLSPIEKRGI